MTTTRWSGLRKFCPTIFMLASGKSLPPAGGSCMRAVQNSRHRMSGLGLLLILCLVARPAHAYLDPGSGSMLVQILLAGFAGVALGLKMFWKRIIAFIKGSKDLPGHHEK